MRTLTSLAIASIFPLALFAACGGSDGSGSRGTGSGGSGGGDAGSGADAGQGGANTAVGGNAGTGGSSGGCDDAADCTGGRVCDTDTGQCVEGSDCVEHRDCPQGAFCDAGTCAPNEPGGLCDTGDNCAPGEQCTGGICGCGGEFYGAESAPPNVLIALDRSGSMNNALGDSTKWETAKDAVSTMLGQSGDTVRWGLKLWPGDDQKCDQGGQCSVADQAHVACGPGTSTSIEMFLGGADTCSFGTPISALVTSIGLEPSLMDDSRENFLVLITDGQQQNCSGDPEQEVADLLADHGIRTFVVGFGSGVDPTTLEDMAIARGTGDYYQADSADQLQSAFAAIAGKVLSCTYHLDPAPPDADALYVYFDGFEVAQDPDGQQAQGWSYDNGSQTLTFFGPDCLSLQQGLVDDLVISYGCPAPVGPTGGSGVGGGGPGGGAPTGGGGAGPTCGLDGESCTTAAECCGGFDCLTPDLVCGVPQPK